jgi:hypothetical protein
VAELLAERRSLEIRNQAIESLIAFTEYTFPKYRAAAFHKTIAGQLERVSESFVRKIVEFGYGIGVRKPVPWSPLWLGLGLSGCCNHSLSLLSG